MKCPKCGFNSFEYLDNCKKCNNDLTAFKQSLGIQSIVLPTTLTTPIPVAEQTDDTAAAVDEGFSWDSNAAAAGETPAFANETAPAPAATDAEFSFEDNAAPSGSFATAQPDAFGEFSFDDMSAQPEADSPASLDTAASEPASSWAGGSEFAASDFPGFADEPAPAAPGLDEILKKEEAKPAMQQKPQGDDLFSSDDFADLFKDEEPGK